MELSERDMLALEWELHHVRWLAGEIAMTVHSALWMRVEDYTDDIRFPDPPRYGEMTREELRVQRDKLLARMPLELDDAICRHAQERQWWAEHKATAPINVLRQAVRREMMRAGGAKGDFDPTEQSGDLPERVEQRSWKWVLQVRASIAERRMRAGKFRLLFEEAMERDPEWGVSRLQVLEQESHPMAFPDLVRGMSLDELEQYVGRSEKAAAQYGATGDHLAPGWIDFKTFQPQDSTTAGATDQASEHAGQSSDPVDP